MKRRLKQEIIKRLRQKIEGLDGISFHRDGKHTKIYLTRGESTGILTAASTPSDFRFLEQIVCDAKKSLNYTKEQQK